MPITYDISKDTLYLKGIQKGVKQEQEKAKAKEKQVIIKLHQSGISSSQIAQILEISEQEVLELIQLNLE